MLDYIKGTIKTVHDDSLTVDIGNVGLKIHMAYSQSFRVGDKADFHLYMHWNMENGPSLYGFSSIIEKEVFLLVISCSGVGPKLGLAVLADLGPEAFLEAVQTENDTMLSKVSGIGAKKAEHIVVQLKHKVAKLVKSGVVVKPSAAIGKMQEISDVLKSLNYSRPEISATMKHLNENSQKDESFDQLIRTALSFLSKKSATR